jgi:hypothetical protein
MRWPICSPWTDTAADTLINAVQSLTAAQVAVELLLDAAVPRELFTDAVNDAAGNLGHYAGTLHLGELAATREGREWVQFRQAYEPPIV